MRHQVELLAPAGSREAFLGAVRAGADAVYLAGQRFGARAYAQNFGEEELIQTIGDAHVMGVKIYLTVNILTREGELPELLDDVERLYKAGLDGVIVQDLGVAAGLRERCPGLLLHASTQNSITGPDGVRWLKRLGYCRVVPARELSLEEMRVIKREEPIEIEAFIHGAMCYSYSGRCLMSSFLGGRSGNRGRCAGTCRLPYQVLDESGRPAARDAGRKETYPLSMKDMCVLEILPELIDAGIDSFKIEGRMKKPEFAAGVTAMYRRYIDRYEQWDAAGRPSPWRVDERDLRELRGLYLRADLSTGYYHQRNGRDLVTIGRGGYAGADEAVLERIREKYLSGLPQREIDGYAYFGVGQEALLSVSCGEVSVSVSGEVVQAAKKRPMSEEQIREKLEKTGETMFTFSSLTVQCDGAVFVPVGQINALRRQALAKLREAVLEEYLRENRQIPQEKAPSLPVRRSAGEHPLLQGRRVTADVLTARQLDAAVAAGAGRIIVERELPLPSREVYPGQILLALPQILRDSDRKWLYDVIKRTLSGSEDRGYDGFLARTPEELSALRERGYRGLVIADHSLYQWNRQAAGVVRADADLSVLPLELDRRELGRTFSGELLSKSLLWAYGRVPMMVSAGCVKKTEGACDHREGGLWGLRDRKKMVFPVRCDCAHCHNVIYNSTPVSLQNFLQDGVLQGCESLLCVFTDEDAGQTERVLHFFARSSGAAAPCEQYTTGHFREGAL